MLAGALKSSAPAFSRGSLAQEHRVEGAVPSLQYRPQPPFSYQHSNLSARKHRHRTATAAHGPRAAPGTTIASRKVGKHLPESKRETEGTPLTVPQPPPTWESQEDGKEIWMYTRNSHEFNRLIINPSQILTEERQPGFYEPY